MLDRSINIVTLLLDRSIMVKEGLQEKYSHPIMKALSCLVEN